MHEGYQNRTRPYVVRSVKAKIVTNRAKASNLAHCIILTRYKTNLEGVPRDPSIRVAMKRKSCYQ